MFAIFPIFFGFVIILIIFGAIAASRRRGELTLWANSIGLLYDPSGDDAHKNFAQTLELLGHKSRGKSSNLIHGTFAGIRWQIFDFTYKTGSGDSETTHFLTIVAGMNGVNTPSLLILRKSIFSRLKDFAGLGEMAFESEEFNTRYEIRCGDRKFAYDLIHPKMIAFLLSVKLETLHFVCGKTVMVFRNQLNASDLEPPMQIIYKAIGLIPGYVRESYQFR